MATLLLWFTVKLSVMRVDFRAGGSEAYPVGDSVPMRIVRRGAPMFISLRVND